MTILPGMRWRMKTHQSSQVSSATPAFGVCVWGDPASCQPDRDKGDSGMRITPGMSSAARGQDAEAGRENVQRRGLSLLL